MTDPTTGLQNHQWIRCCRFKPKQRAQPETKAHPMTPLTGQKRLDLSIASRDDEKPLLQETFSGQSIHSSGKTVPSMTLIDGKGKKKRKSVFRKLFSCFYRDSGSKNRAKYIADGDLLSITKESNAPMSPTPVKCDEQLAVDTSAVDENNENDEELMNQNSALLQSIHDHFMKTIMEESGSEMLSEFVEKTIGALFFDLNRGGPDFSDCCGLQNLTADSPFSHIGVSMCFTAPGQLTKLDSCLDDRSFITAVKNSVFPMLHRAASTSNFTSSSISGAASPIGLASTDTDDSCHARSPVSDIQESLTVMPSDIEMFVVVRQTSINSVMADLQPSSSSTQLRNVSVAPLDTAVTA